MEKMADAISIEQAHEYRTRGLLFQGEVFSAAEIAILKRQAAAEFEEDSPRRTLEKESGAVRGVHGGHLYRAELARLVRLPRLLLAARHLLQDDVYVYQFKINAKRAFKGEVWEWHQDYIFWCREDYLSAPNAVTVAIFLDDVTEFNGPLTFIPGAHKEGMIDVSPKPGDWSGTLAADLKYSLTPDTVKSLARRHGLATPKGRQGSVLWFDCNIPHSSAPNMSPYDRALILITYNAVSNALRIASDRPEWLVSREATALVPVEDRLEP